MQNSRVILGICLILITYPLNHIDYLIPEFESISLLGKSFRIVDGFTSTDIIWTVIQKVNLILLCIATLLLVPLKIYNNNKFKFLIPSAIFLIISLNLFLAIGDVHSYVMGFNKTLYIITFLFLILVMVSITILSHYYIRKRESKINKLKLEVEELKKEIGERVSALKDKDSRLNRIQSKVDTIQDTNIFISEKIEALEYLPLFIKETDDMETWSELAHRRAMMIYGQLDKQLKDLEDTRNIAV